MAPAAKRRLDALLTPSRHPLGEDGDPAVLRDTPQQRRRVPLPIGLALPSLGLVVCVDRMTRHATVDLQRDRVLVRPSEVGGTLAKWDKHWAHGTGSLPTAAARKFITDLRGLEDTLASVGL